MVKMIFDPSGQMENFRNFGPQGRFSRSADPQVTPFAPNQGQRPELDTRLRALITEAFQSSDYIITRKFAYRFTYMGLKPGWSFSASPQLQIVRLV